MIDLENMELAGEQLKYLSDFLTKHTTFTILELMGFFAAINSAPRQIDPSEWFKEIDGGSSPFKSQKRAEKVIPLIFTLYNQINRNLRKEHDSPLNLFEDQLHGQTSPGETAHALYSAWFKGYMRGMDLAGTQWLLHADCREAKIIFHALKELGNSIIRDEAAATPEKIALLNKHIMDFYNFWKTKQKENYKKQFPLKELGLIGELISELNDDEEFPTTAIESLLQHKDEAIPLLLELLKYRLDDYKRRTEDHRDFIIALYILAYFKEQQTFPLIMRFLSLPSDWSEKILGDLVTEVFTSLIVSTYNGNFETLKTVIENETLYWPARSAALHSLLGLFATQKLTRTEIIDYLRNLMRSELTNNIIFSGSLTSVASALYPQELYSDIMNLYEKNLIDSFYIDEDTVQKRLDMGQASCLQKNIYTQNHYMPITNVFDHLSWMHPKRESQHYTQAYTKLPKLGRNEPCFCKSGKKYKKCCLQKEAYA